MCTKKQLNVIAHSMLEVYKKAYGEAIVEVLLYGSYARGDFQRDSDIDFAAIVEGGRVDLQKKLKTIWDESAEIGIKHDVVVSPTVIPFDEYERYKSVLPYYMNIWKEGIRIG